VGFVVFIVHYCLKKSIAIQGYMGVQIGGTSYEEKVCSPMLTEIQIRNAKPREKPHRLYDERGMYIEIRPHGGKGFRLKYRFEGKYRYLALGMWPEVSLKEARVRRDEARKLVQAGIDPMHERKAKKLSAASDLTSTFESVAREWYLRYSPTWAESHSKTVLRRLEKDVFPWMGQRDISEIMAPELLDVIRRVEGRGALETAHRELTICGQVFRYAVATGRAERDPSQDLRGALPPVQSKHLAATTDPKRVGELLRMIWGYQGGLVVRCALKLGALLAVRPGELRKAKWSEIDFDKRQWAYLVTKTKTPHIVPLSDQALAILQELHPLTGGGEWVFPGRTHQRCMSENGVLAALRSLGIEKDEMCGHGWRAVFRTLLAEELGYRIELIEMQLAHRVPDAHGRAYNRTQFLAERRAMMQRWADYLEGLKTSD
jgi:integrase